MQTSTDTKQCDCVRRDPVRRRFHLPAITAASRPTHARTDKPIQTQHAPVLSRPNNITLSRRLMTVCPARPRPPMSDVQMVVAAAGPASVHGLVAGEDVQVAVVAGRLLRGHRRYALQCDHPVTDGAASPSGSGALQLGHGCS